MVLTVPAYLHTLSFLSWRGRHRTCKFLVQSQAGLPIGLLRHGGGEGNRTLVGLLAEQVPDQHEQRPPWSCGTSRTTRLQDEDLNELPAMARGAPVFSVDL